MASLKRPCSSTHYGHDVPSKVQVIDLTDDATPVSQFRSAVPIMTAALAHAGSVMAQFARPVYIDNRGSAYHPQFQVPQPVSNQNPYLDPRTPGYLGYTTNEPTHLAAPPLSSYEVAYQTMPAPSGSQASPYSRPVQQPQHLQPSTNRKAAPVPAMNKKSTIGRTSKDRGTVPSYLEKYDIRQVLAKVPGIDSRLEEALHLIDEFDGQDRKLLLQRTVLRYKHQADAILKFEQEKQRDRINQPFPFWNYCAEIQQILWEDYKDLREPELSLVACEGWSEISCEIWKLVARLKPDLHVSMKRDAWDTSMEIGEDLTGWSGTECTQKIRELAQNDATLSQAIYHCFSTFTIEDKTELEDTSWLNRLERLKEKFELHDLNCDLTQS